MIIAGEGTRVPCAPLCLSSPSSLYPPLQPPSLSPWIARSLRTPQPNLCLLSMQPPLLLTSPLLPFPLSTSLFSLSTSLSECMVSPPCPPSHSPTGPSLGSEQGHQAMLKERGQRGGKAFDFPSVHPLPRGNAPRGADRIIQALPSPRQGRAAALVPLGSLCCFRDAQDHAQSRGHEVRHRGKSRLALVPDQENPNSAPTLLGEAATLPRPSERRLQLERGKDACGHKRVAALDMCVVEVNSASVSVWYILLVSSEERRRRAHPHPHPPSHGFLFLVLHWRLETSELVFVLVLVCQLVPCALPCPSLCHHHRTMAMACCCVLVCCCAGAGSRIDLGSVLLFLIYYLVDCNTSFSALRSKLPVHLFPRLANDEPKKRKKGRHPHISHRASWRIDPLRIFAGPSPWRRSGCWCTCT